MSIRSTGDGTKVEVKMPKRQMTYFFIFSIYLTTILAACSNNSGSKYKCKTDDTGLIPVKVIISRYPRATIYSDADLNKPTGNNVDYFYKAYYVFDTKNDFYQIGLNPFDKNSLTGWVKKNDALLWSTNQALQFAADNTNRYFWEDKNVVDSLQPKYMLHVSSSDAPSSFPIIASDRNKYQIALDYKNVDGSNDKGADIGWTQDIRLGQDAFGLCYISKSEFAARIEALQKSIQNMKKDKSDNPVRDILQNVLKLNFGNGTDTEGKSFNVLQLIGKQAPIPVAQQNPADIRSNNERYKKKIARMREYLQNSDYWDQYGFGKIPIELVN